MHILYMCIYIYIYICMYVDCVVRAAGAQLHSQDQLRVRHARPIPCCKHNKINETHTSTMTTTTTTTSNNDSNK